MVRPSRGIREGSLIVLFLSISFVYAQTAVDYVQRGNAYYEQGKYDQAISDYTKAIDINPDFAKAYDNRGAAYAQKGNLSGAISDFTMAIANNPNDAEAYNNRGHAYAKLGNYVQAISDYTKAIKINPNYIKAYNNRAHVFYDIKKYDRAWADVQKAEELGITVDPDFIEELKQASGLVHPSLINLVIARSRSDEAISFHRNPERSARSLIEQPSSGSCLGLDINVLLLANVKPISVQKNGFPLQMNCAVSVRS